MNKKEMLSIEEAKAQGYKYAMVEYGEGELIEIDDCSPLEKNYLLVSKEGKPFTIPDDLIQDLVDDYLCNQDEVADEDGFLNDLAAKVDYTEITNKINAAFSNTKYYYSADIKLIV